MIQAALLTMLLATGDVHSGHGAPRNGPLGAHAHAHVSGPGHAHEEAHRPFAPRKLWPHSASPNRWLWRYTIVDGTHYVIPHDYRTELDLPWHSRVPYGAPYGAPYELHSPHGLPLEVLPERDMPPPPEVPHETVYPDVNLGPQARRPR